MRSAVRGLLLAGAICLPALSVAGDGKLSFARPVALRGTLGDAPIQVTLRAKDGADGGIEGEYFLFGHSRNILLAGEFEEDEMLLEESENGTDVSGHWSGKLSGETIAGEWQSLDGAVTRPFRIKIVTSAKPH